MSHEDLYKFATERTDGPLRLDIHIPGEWHVMPPVPWYRRIWWWVLRYTLDPVKRLWWSLTDDKDDL